MEVQGHRSWLVAQVRFSSRPRVVDVAGSLHHEAGPTFNASAEKTAIVVHFAEQPLISRSTETLVAEFVAAGYSTALVSSAPCREPLQFQSPDNTSAVSVYRRANIGYDFGTWASFINAFPALRRAPRVVLANDSLVGPFRSISDILEGFEACPTDVWGITGTTQDGPHLQSHFVGYKDGVLAEPALVRFWRDVRVEPSKRQLILRYEIGLSRLASSEGYVLAAHFPWHWTTSLGGNPTSAGWYRLMLRGFPFVKRELVLRPPTEVPDLGQVPQVISKLWGQNVLEWV